MEYFTLLERQIDRQYPLYHGTSFGNLSGIINDGFLDASPVDEFGDGVSLTSSIGVGETFARDSETRDTQGREDGVLLQFRSDVLRPLGLKRIRYDGPEEKEMRVMGRIPARMIENIIVTQPDLDNFMAGEESPETKAKLANDPRLVIR